MKKYQDRKESEKEKDIMRKGTYQERKQRVDQKPMTSKCTNEEGKDRETKAHDENKYLSGTERQSEMRAYCTKNS